jgi:hypothetical protein
MFLGVAQSAQRSNNWDNITSFLQLEIESPPKGSILFHLTQIFRKS